VDDLVWQRSRPGSEAATHRGQEQAPVLLVDREEIERAVALVAAATRRGAW